MYRRWSFALLLVACLLATFLSASIVGATPASEWYTGDGSIYKAKTLPDGSHVDLILEDIIKIKDDYIVVAEPFRPQDRLIILAKPDPELRLGQVIDASGSLTTLPSGERALQNATIRGYISADTGELIYHPGIIKAFPGAEQQSWPWKTDLTVDTAVSTASTSASYSSPSDVPNSDPAEGPKYYARIAVSAGTVSSQSRRVQVQDYYGSVPGLLQTRPVAGSLVELQCKLITTAGTEMIGGITYKYFDMADDSAPLDVVRCYYSAGTATTDKRVNKIFGQVQYTNGGTDLVICIDDGPDYDPQILEGRVQLVSEGTIPYIWSQADGATASLSGKVVTANNSIDFPGSLYVQEPSGSGSFGGIRVDYSTSSFARGELVTISGAVAMGSDGERKIAATSVTSTGSDTVPMPLGMPNKYLGGGAFNTNTPGVDYPTGSGTGLYNKGLLVKSWGKVTSVNDTSNYFYIDDGTGFLDGSGNTGVKVSWNWATSGKADIIIPEVGLYVSVAGISSSESDTSSNLIRVLRPRKYDDILTLDPQDAADPTVTITSPSGTEWHKASNATSVYIMGTAFDSDTGIKSVEIKIGSDDWEDISSSYIAASGTWSYTWVTPAAISPTTIQVRATDYAGNSDTQSVTISNVDAIYVSPNGSNSNAGDSWATAKRTIGATNGAMLVASSGDEIWVAEGTYVECVTLGSGVALYGGFSGNETVCEQRNWTTNKTIIDGNKAGRTVSITGTASSLTRLDGFTIQNGSTNLGGGIYASTSAVIFNNVIRNNKSTSQGGGIYSSSTVTIADNLLLDNTAVDGAGIYATSASQISGNTLMNNTASTSGGGIHISYSSVTISDNNIVGNCAANGGALYIYGSTSTSTLINNTITANTATGSGGGIFVYSGSPKIVNNTVVSNFAVGNGGGIYVSSGSTTVTNNVIAFNSYGIYSGVSLSVSNNCFYGNTGGKYSTMVTSTNEVEQDPLLVSTSYGNMHLQSGSPCIDHGLDSAYTPSTDMDGNTRPIDGDNDQTAIVDIGADEYDGTAGSWVVNRFYVDNAVSASGDGESWTTAFKTAQEGINAASKVGGDVWVRGNGTSNAYNECLTLRPYAHIYGGFDTTETDPDDRDLSANITILDGQQSGSVITLKTGYNEVSRIDGFTIQNGKTSKGGGIYISYSSPTIINNTITGSTVNYSGGGVYTYYGSPTITNNTISANTTTENGVTSSDGAGIYTYYGSPTISSNSIFGNSASTSGGGVYICNGTPYLSNNTISGNTAQSGSGVYTYYGSPILSNNIIRKNSANHGSGVYAYYGSPVFTNNTISGNTAVNNGGGIYSSYGSPSFTENDINGNLSANGGGIYANYGSPSFMKNVISGNTSTNGSGVYLYGDTPSLANNTISANAATTYGGGIYIYSGSPTIVNNTIISNYSASSGGGIYASSGVSPKITNNIFAFNSYGIYSGASLTVLNNCFYNNTGGKYSANVTSTDEVAQDPLLISTSYADVHLQSGSPCVDHGLNNSPTITYVPSTDIDGDPRPIDGDNNQTDVVDIGADEYNGTTTPFVANRLYVDNTVSASGDGTGWTTAFKTIQEGIDAASLVGGDVWVRGKGSSHPYKECIALKPYVYVYGGFDTTETDIDDRDWNINKTIVDGQQSGSVVTSKTGYNEVSRIDGFTIENGNSTNGGGIYICYSSPTFANNNITGNIATSSGGAVYISKGSPTFINNTITANSADAFGGGICMDNSSSKVVNNTIVSNVGSSSTTNGGGIHVYSGSPIVTNNIIAFNAYGVYSAVSLAVSNNCFFGNTGAQYSANITSTNEISQNPLLVSTSYGNMHLQSGSPCIDHGLASAYTPSTDMDSNTRPLDGDNNQTAILDIGADEYDGTTSSLVVSRFHVDNTVSASGDGTSWTTAFKTVQEGIDAASVLGGDVWVRGNGSSHPYKERIALKPYAYVYGGFDTTEADINDRDWNVNNTILDGQKSGSVVTVKTGYNEVSRIDGFVIENGSASNGGGINISRSSPLISNNRIVENSATSNGGGAYVYWGSPTLTNNVISGNTAVTNGGGVHIYTGSPKVVNNTIVGNFAASSGGGVYVTSGTPTVTNNILAFNSYGIYSSVGLAISNNCFYGNTSGKYSATISSANEVEQDPLLVSMSYGNTHLQSSSPCIDHGLASEYTPSTDMDGNPRPIDGDSNQTAIVDIGADEYDGTTSSLVVSRFHVDNTVSASGNGTSWTTAFKTVQEGIDAASVVGGDVWVRGNGLAHPYKECIALKPYAYVYGGFDTTETDIDDRDWKTHPAILDGQQSGSSVTVTSGYRATSRIDGFTIRNGYASNGGGIYIYGSSPTIANNRIVGNSTSGNGGGIYGHYGFPNLVGNVVVNNDAANGGGIYCDAYTGGQIANNTIFHNTSSSSVTSNCGGGIYLYATASTSLTNNIVAFNCGGGIYRSTEPACTKNILCDNTTSNYSWNTNETYHPSNDLAPANPGIARVELGDFHLSQDSPCRDAGDNDLVSGILPDKDIDAENRIFDDPNVVEDRVDIGADEWNGADPSVNPNIIYVWPNGNDDNGGSSWSDAVATVQQGIKLAYGAGYAEVWVAAGTYGAISLKPYVSVYGGFDTDDECRSDRNWKTNETVLDGGSTSSVVTISYALCARIDGFTIQKGSATNGGAINCSSSSVTTIANNIIRDNSATSNGGGIYVSDCNPLVSGNVFLANNAAYGGGMYYSGNTGGQVANNTIFYNSAKSICAGGIYLSDTAAPVLANNIVAFNIGSGIYRTSAPTCVKNDVYGNSHYGYSWDTSEAYHPDNDLAPADPMIPNIEYGDWHISEDSPCRDQGTSVYGILDKDIDAENRIYDNPNVVEDKVDIGADEWHGTDPSPIIGSATVGFLYYLYDHTLVGTPDIDFYLEKVDDDCTDVAYSRIDSKLSYLYSYDAVFVALPRDVDLTMEINALAAFANTPGKRLVLIGENTSVEPYYHYNNRLNTLLAAIGVGISFKTVGSDDGYKCYPQVCAVNSSDPLMNGVTGLWYERTGDCSMGANSVALAYGATTGVPGPWVAKESTPGGGSVVCIHDSNSFGACDVMDHLDFTNAIYCDPDKNLRFVTNLCTIE